MLKMAKLIQQRREQPANSRTVITRVYSTQIPYTRLSQPTHQWQLALQPATH
ncbi:hypothetical protein ACFP1L_07625 [Lactiplantibacillus nangangensis]|uniref:Uncharacterized protein n=1 Tax=Lactiplantibacillus nangangensis TaxID=2559917 RepID=A0ABW1SJ40_9LACO|nr:hypothetical protein [Lactiplantibacillus nangangensis]